MMNCTICSHPKRAEIEQDVLSRSFVENPVTLADIAKKYEVSYNDLLVHVLMHVSVTTTLQPIQESLAGEIKRAEANIIYAQLEDNYILAKNLGAKLNDIIARHDDQHITLNQITKPVVDLYLGANLSSREAAEKLMKMNLVVNGEKNNSFAGVLALVETLKGNRDGK